MKNINRSCLIGGMQAQRRWLFVVWSILEGTHEKPSPRAVQSVRTIDLQILVCRLSCDYFFLQCKPMMRGILSDRLVDSQKLRVWRWIKVNEKVKLLVRNDSSFFFFFLTGVAPFHFGPRMERRRMPRRRGLSSAEIRQGEYTFYLKSIINHL